MNKLTRRRWKQWAMISLLLLSIFGNAPVTHAQTPDSSALPAKVYLPLVAQHEQGKEEEGANAVIPNEYIVVFNDELMTASSVAAVAAELASSVGGELLQTYDAALNGFALKLPSAVITGAMVLLQNDARIGSIEPNRFVQLSPLGTLLEEGAPLTTTTSISESVQSAAVAESAVVQSNPPWGLDRIDQRTLPLNRQYNYNLTGAGVRVFVIDSGIRIAHTEFQGRAGYGIDTVDGSLPADDCYGHGTHVAGTIGGQTYGVAKGVQLIAVRVLDCRGGGKIDGVIAGVDWVTRQRRANPTTPMVANMSLGSSPFATLDLAVQNSIAAGVTYVIAGGNANSSACNETPARVAAAITVGATTSADGRATFSNFGSCLDLFAPGVSIQSAWYTSNYAVATISGTSMAAPHVAGVAALYLQSNPGAAPATVANALTSAATLNVVSNPGNGSPNRLLYSQLSAPPPPPGPFNKTYPGSTATDVPASILLTWDPSAGAAYYLYCIDTTHDLHCDWGDNNFRRVDGTSVNADLAPNTTYSWQVRAYNSSGQWTPGNGSGQWWTFTTGNYPAPFNKIYPGKNATGIPTVVTLSWQPSAGATYYLYCVDTTHDLHCDWGDNNFKRVNGTSATEILLPNRTYSWQVRAFNASGRWTPGNGSGQWWTFTTRP